MMEVVHDEMCLKTKAAFIEFIALWPNYCQYCGGYGVWSTPGTRLDPPDGGPCTHCVEQGKCPRCASENIRVLGFRLTDYVFCNECGWNELAIIEGWSECRDMAAPIHECWCYELPTNHEFVGIDENVDECLVCGLKEAPHGVRN